MQQHFDQERALQGRIEAALSGVMPGAAVLDVEYDAPGEVVRVFVDREGEPVDLAYCTEVTRVLREAEAVDDFGLEVSSPGLERPLRHLEHFRAASGSRVNVRRRGAKRPVAGTVGEVGDGWFELRREGAEPERIELGQVARAHLDATEAVEAALKAAKIAKADRASEGGGAASKRRSKDSRRSRTDAGETGRAREGGRR